MKQAGIQSAWYQKQINKYIFKKQKENNNKRFVQNGYGETGPGL